MGPNIAFGRQSDHDNCTKPDTLLFAPDILPRHCHFQRHCVGGPTVLRPSPNATLTRNGEALRKEVQLMPGDIIGMGQSYLFLFKDPLASAHKVRVGRKRDRPTVTCATYSLSSFLSVKIFV